MTLRRRDFTCGALGSAVSLALLGCSRAGDSQTGRATNEAGRLAEAPFTAGPVAAFAQPGVYVQAADRGVFLISDGAELIAISGICTHAGCGVAWRPEQDRYLCDCHGSAFSPEGVLRPNSGPAKTNLHRLPITHEGDQVRIDPTRQLEADADGQFPQDDAALAIT